MSQGHEAGQDVSLKGKCVALCTYSAWSVLNYRQGLVKALLAAGAKVVVVSPEDAFVGQVQALGCVFEPMDLNTRGTSPWNDFKGFLRYRRVFKKHNVDLVINYTIKPVIYATLGAGLSGRKVINTITGIGETFNQKPLVRAVIKTLYRVSQRYADVVFFQNKDQRGFFLEMGLMKESQTRMIAGSGVDTKKYAFVDLKINPVFTFLLMGRLLKPKGIYEYVEAGRILRKLGLNVKLQLAGEFTPGRDIAVEEADLKAWTGAGEVEYLGMVADVPGLIAQADCVVLPSYTEGTPRALLEACAVGRPIIATNVEGCREVLVNGENGLFCEVRNAQSLADAMAKMAGLSFEVRLEMGRTGRYLAEEKFDEGKVVGVYMKTVKELVG